MFKVEAVQNSCKVKKKFWIKFLLAILNSTQQNSVFQLYCRSYSDYLCEMSRMDEGQAVPTWTVNFERLPDVEFRNIKDL